jgi:asparagine synthase (glutamine-hydrolysing)
MLIFIAGWQLSARQRHRVPEVLRQVAAAYPTVDTSHSYKFIVSDRAFVQVLAAPLAMSAPSLPVTADSQGLTFIAGAAVDPSGRFNPMHARQLAGHRDTWTELEGQFVALHASHEGLEIVNDAFGIFPVFVLRQGESYLISNSATALAVLGNISALDPLGVSTFIGSRWAAADRTLVQQVTVMPGAQKWRWTQGKGLSQETYHDYTKVTRQPKVAPSDEWLLHNAGQLSTQLSLLAEQTRALHIPISGGRDTRVMVALSLEKNPDAPYFTVGDSSRTDVHIGKEIAERYGLQHRHDEIDPAEITDNWQQLAQQVVRRNDGMVTLAHIRNAIETVSYDHLPMMLYGAGGEIARGHYHDFATCFGRPSKAHLVHHLHDKLVGYKTTLLTDTAHEHINGYLQQFVDHHVDQGIASEDIPEIFYLQETTRRWGGNQFRQVMNSFEVFSPFCTRPYVDAAFALSAQWRVMEVLPLGLIRVTRPELLALPFDKSPSPSTVKALRREMQRKHRTIMLKSVARKLRIAETLKQIKIKKPEPKEFGRLEERVYWFEASSETIREFCLDQTGSQLWRYVSRSDFERVMYKGNVALRQENLGRIYNIVTAFYYEAYLRSLLAKNVLTVSL